jgi:hypothetical protein
MSFDSLLIHHCYLGTPASSQNTLGEWQVTWAYSSDTTDCRVQPIMDSERITSPGRYDGVTSRIYFNPDVSVYLGYRIKYKSEYYRIIDLRFDSSAHHQQALVAQTWEA